MYIYLIRCCEYSKIGVATDLKKRMDALQVGNPFELYLHDAYSFEHGIWNIEYTLHKMFEGHAKRGEWFMLDGEDFDRFKDFCLSHDGAPARDEYYKSLKMKEYEKRIIKGDSTDRADIIRLLRLCVKYNDVRHLKDNGVIYSGQHLRVNTDWYANIVRILQHYKLVHESKDGLIRTNRSMKVSTLLSMILDGRVKFKRRTIIE